jgi:hypothetical protein
VKVLLSNLLGVTECYNSDVTVTLASQNARIDAFSVTKCKHKGGAFSEPFCFLEIRL